MLRRVARIWKRGGGAILKEWEVCKRPWLEFSLTWKQFQTVYPKIETRKIKVFFRPKLGGLQKKKKRSSPKLSVVFRPKSEIQRFFPPNIRWSPKKKRSSPISRLIFRPISQIQSFEGSCFRMGGLFSIFLRKSASKAQKTCNFAYFTSQWGGARAPPAPPLATLLFML